jgi:hypothetical protein
MKYTLAKFKAKLVTDPRWTSRALVVLYELQTQSEKQGKHTSEVNAAGFNKFDADFLSQLAERIQSGTPLTLGQMASAQKSIGKYAKQLYRIAQSKEKENGNE